MNKKILVGGLFLTVLFIAWMITGTIDYNAANGIHKVSGIVVNGKVQSETGKMYSVASSFETGTKVTMVLNGDGVIQSIVTE